MSLNEFLNDKKYTAAFFLLALCFFLVDWYLFAAVGEKEEHIRRLETEPLFWKTGPNFRKEAAGCPFWKLFSKILRQTRFSPPLWKAAALWKK